MAIGGGGSWAADGTMPTPTSPMASRAAPRTPIRFLLCSPPSSHLPRGPDGEEALARYQSLEYLVGSFDLLGEERSEPEVHFHIE